MSSVLNTIWSETIQPMLRRPKALQLAALCHRDTPDGVEVLLITSSSGRWILPKGWPIDGLSAAEAASVEAWEEGGIKEADFSDTAIGTLQTQKTYDSGLTIPTETHVYDLTVKKVANDYPEADKRDRIWVSPARAAELVEDPNLKELLAKF